MEELKNNFEEVKSSIKNFTDSNNNEIAELKKSNLELEKSLAENKSNMLELARKFNEQAEKSEKSIDDSAELEKKYLQEADQALRGKACGIYLASDSAMEVAHKYAESLAQKQNFLSQETEKKFANGLLSEVQSKSMFPIFDVKTQLTSVGSDGGFMLKPTKQTNYVPTFNKLGLIDLVNRIPVNSGSLSVLAQRAVEDGFWEGEEGSNNANGFGVDTINISTSIVKGRVRLTRSLIEDFQGNLYSYIYPLMTESLNNAIERALFMGDGQNNRPKGICTYDELPAGVDYKVGCIKTVGVDNIKEAIDEIGELSIRLQVNNKVILMHPETLAAIYKEKATDGRSLLQENFLLNGAEYRIAGLKVYTSTFCPKMLNGMGSPISGAKGIIVGDFKKAYDLIERTSKTVDLNPYNNNNEVIDYMLRQRVGGAVKGFDSIAIIKNN